MHEDLLSYFRKTVELEASDLILRAGQRPVVRRDGQIVFLSEDRLSDQVAEQLVDAILEPEERVRFHEAHEWDTAFVIPELGRFRANLLLQRRQLAFVFRYVKDVIPTMEALHLPVAAMQQLCALQRGLVLVTGVSGSGKSTTLATMIEYMNENSQRHVVTLEDPIEYVFHDKRCAVTQREVGIDTGDFQRALKAVVRQTPDVILVGEMRDLETVSAALMAAETGHLVLATLHTVNAVQTMERVLSFFPPYQQETVRLQLALVLEGIVSQRLVRRRTVGGRVPAVEVLMGTPTIKEMVLEGRTRELPQALEAGHEYYGTQTFNQSLVHLVRAGLVDVDDAMGAADNPDELRLALRGITKGVSGGGGAWSPPETEDRARFSGTSSHSY